MIYINLSFTVNSPVFRTMFENPSMTEVKEGRMTISDMGDFSLTNMIDWMYSGKVDFGTEAGFDSVVLLYKASHKYCIDQLKKLLKDEFLSSSYAKPENALDLFVLGKVYEDEQLVDKAKKIIKT